jgi:transcriptional regulator with XRE-family HTH domain
VPPAFNPRVLREWRLGSDMTAEQVCAAAPISYPYLRSLEDGRATNPSARVLARLAAVYGRDLGELFTDDDAERAGAR